MQKLQAVHIAALSASNAAEGSERLQRHGAVRAILIDFSGLNPERVQTLIALRQTLSAAAIPIWGLRDAADANIERVLAAHRDIVTRPKAYRPELLDDWVDQVIDLID